MTPTALALLLLLCVLASGARVHHVRAVSVQCNSFFDAEPRQRTLLQMLFEPSDATVHEPKPMPRCAMFSPETFFFEPRDLVVDCGDSVRWSWDFLCLIAQAQNATSTERFESVGAFASEPVAQGEFWHTFEHAGVFHYLSEVYSLCRDMRGTVSVRC